MIERVWIDLARGSRCAVVLMVLAHCAPPDPPDPPDTRETQSSALIPGNVFRSPAGTLKWFFADGGSSPFGHQDAHHFTTYYNFTNLNNDPVQVIGYFVNGPSTNTVSFSLAANSRTTREFSELSTLSGFYSAEFYSNTPGREIQVSATMLNNGFDTHQWSASAAFNGTTEARRIWRFGEGGAYGWLGSVPVFDNMYVIYNPTGGPLSVTGTFHSDDVDPRAPGLLGAVAVSGRNRVEIRPFESISAGNTMQVRSATIECTADCVVQLVMRQRRSVGLRQTNSQTALGSSQSHNWYFVGIPTSAEWNPRLYMYNQGDFPSQVHFTYRSDSGSELVRAPPFSIQPRSRHTYDIRDVLLANRPASQPALDKAGNIGLHIFATQPISITKILYWPYGGSGFQWSEGGSTTGHSDGGARVVIPGGNIGGGFSNYVQVMNVGDRTTDVWSTIYPEGRAARAPFFVGTIPPMGMRQIDASGAYPGLDGNFATVLDAVTPGAKIIAESSTYFDYTGSPQLWRAGDAVEGIVMNADKVPIQP